MPPDGDLCTCFACENGGANGGHHISPDPNCEHCREFDPSPSSLYYSSSLGYVSAPLSDSEKLRRVVTASIKGFTIGAGLAIFSILARLRRRKLLASLRTAKWRAIYASYLTEHAAYELGYLHSYAHCCVSFAGWD
ncbi:hypothetical protein ACFX2C_019607 [Malus domestica]